MLAKPQILPPPQKNTDPWLRIYYNNFLVCFCLHKNALKSFLTSPTCVNMLHVSKRCTTLLHVAPERAKDENWAYA
jgi:hypothetical protein